MTMMLDEYMGLADDVEDIKQEIYESSYDNKTNTYFFKLRTTKQQKPLPPFTGFWGELVNKDVLELPDPPEPPKPPSSRRIGGTIFFE